MARLIRPPFEGSLDREQLVVLVDHLIGETQGGEEATCFCFFGLLAQTYEDPVVFQGALGEIIDLYDSDESRASPSNIWTTDHEWLVTTDWDLWGTRRQRTARPHREG